MALPKMNNEYSHRDHHVFFTTFFARAVLICLNLVVNKSFESMTVCVFACCNEFLSKVNLDLLLDLITTYTKTISSTD
jgi:hypothetical protein